MLERRKVIKALQELKKEYIYNQYSYTALVKAIELVESIPESEDIETDDGR